MKIIHNIVLPIEATHSQAVAKALKTVSLPLKTKAYIYRESMDNRHGKLAKVFSVAIDTEDENPQLKPLKEYSFEDKGKINTFQTPYVIGMGPAGLFCALMLTEFGIKPILVERGDPILQRVRSVEAFWNGGALDEDSNVQFGEGGAGTFSDGKLTTRINDPRCRKVLEIFVQYGAPEEILYRAKPHIGTDVLRKVVVNIRNEIVARGGKILYRTKLDDIVIKNGNIDKISLNGALHPAEKVVLAVGNGAFDTFKMLMSKNLVLESKPCSFGFRQEHLQNDINYAIYGKNLDILQKTAGADMLSADYSFFTHLSPTVCVYTFCMCPGGQVVNSSSMNGRLVTNGMSYHARNGKNANAAMLVSVTPKDISEAMALQELIERNAFKAANGKGPICRGEDLFGGKINNKKGIICPTFLPETEYVDFAQIFPPTMLASLRKGTAEFNKKMFKNRQIEPPVYTAPETRTSSPLRIKRDIETFKAIGINGLYPCGEGAGYAGGIMSSAVDGIRVAEAVLY